MVTAKTGDDKNTDAKDAKDKSKNDDDGGLDEDG